MRGGSDDLSLHQPAFPWAYRTAGLPPGRRAQDSSRRTDQPFEYRFRIPTDEAPGLYWYHPHVHGFTSPQVLGGASGALIVEGIERANLKLAGLPERVFVIRDQDLLNPDAQPLARQPTSMPLVLRDNEGDILNTGTDGGKPAKDLSINFVPVAFPEYTPAVIRIKPVERQLWRVLNASAITYLNLQVLLNGAPQLLGRGVAGRNPHQRERHVRQSHHLGKPHSAASCRPCGIYCEGAACGSERQFRHPEG